MSTDGAVVSGRVVVEAFVVGLVVGRGKGWSDVVVLLVPLKWGIFVDVTDSLEIVV